MRELGIPMIFKRLSFFILILLFSCTVSQKTDTEVTAQSVKRVKPSYFIPVPISNLSSIQVPCIEVDVEGTTLSMELDLGFRGYLTVPKEYIHVIPSKFFLQEKPMYGVRGKEYPTNLYRIPKVRIGKMTFLEPVLQEGTMEFLKDSVFLQDGGEPSSRRGNGRLGWELFYNTNLLVDMKNSQIAFCDSLATLKEQGYDVENFIRAPLFLKRGLVEIQGETPEGPLLCVLDTGATWNILHSELKDETSMDQAMWDPDYTLQCPSFKIEGNDFGPISFHCIPINIPIPVEAILGMEFFQENLVFLDFSGKSAYFLKTPKTN